MQNRFVGIVEYMESSDLRATALDPQAKFRAHHEKRLEEIRRRAPGTGTVGNAPPYTAHLVHLKTRPRKKAILAARDAQVERANRCDRCRAG